MATDPEQVQLKETEDDYDPYQRPPRLDIARKHQLANRYAKVAQHDDKCPCCGLPTGLTDFPICCPRRDFNLNGPGIALYFDFIVFAIGLLISYLYILLLQIRVVAGSYNIYENYHSNHCGSPCRYYNQFSLVNHSSESLGVIQPLLNLFSSVVLMVATLLYHKRIKMIAAEVDAEQITVQDYSIMVQDLPTFATSEQIKEFFQGANSGVEVKNICMGYDISPYVELLQEVENKEASVTTLLQQSKKGESFSTQRQATADQIAILEKKLDEYEENYKKLLNFSGVCFVSFALESQVETVQRMFKMSRLEILFLKMLSMLNIKQERLFQGYFISVTRVTKSCHVKAPEPGDIQWENLGVPFWRLLVYKSITWCASLVVLGCCFGIILGVQLVQIDIAKESDSEIGVLLLGIVASLIVVIINSVLAAIMRKFAVMERSTTETEFNISIAKKLGLAQFLNTALITLFVNIFVNKSDRFVSQISRSSGLNQAISLIFFTNSISPALFTILDPLILVRLFKRKSIIKQGSSCTLTQHWFEGLPVDLAMYYATVTKTIMLTFFYAHLLPWGSIFAAVGLSLSYWAEKWMLLRRDNRPPPLSDQLASEMVNFNIEMMIVAYAAGCCTWESYVFEKVHPATYVQLALSILYYLLPLEIFFESCLREAEVLTSKPYDEVRHIFWADYDRSNPITMQKAMDEWVDSGVLENNKHLVKRFVLHAHSRHKERMTRLVDKISGKIPIGIRIGNLTKFQPQVSPSQSSKHKDKDDQNNIELIDSEKDRHQIRHNIHEDSNKFQNDKHLKSI